MSVAVGVAPDCPYGYYDVAPYTCAPAGYYGPEWFNDGVFIGVGPWFRGHDDFQGYVGSPPDALLPDRSGLSYGTATAWRCKPTGLHFL